MKGKKIFKKIVVSVLTLAIMCSNIPVTAGSMPEDEITVVTEEASEPETSDEMPEAEETTGPEQSGPSAPEGGDVLGDGTDETPSVTETPADTEEKLEEAPGTDAPSDNPPVQDPSAPPAEGPSAPTTEDLEEPSTEDPDASATEDPAVPPTEAPDTPAMGDPAVPPTDEPNAPVTEDPIMPPAEEEPEEEYIEEDDPLDYEDQMPIEDASRFPDEEGVVSTIWAARAPRAMLFALYSDVNEQEADNIENKTWSFDAYYVNQAAPFQVTKNDDFDLKYQMEFHADQDLAPGAVFIKIEKDIYQTRDGQPVAPSEIAVPKVNGPDESVKSRTTPFNYYELEEEGKTYLVFFNYKKISSGSNAAWQILYKNQKLMEIRDETVWTLTPQVSVDTDAVAPSKDDPEGTPARVYDEADFDPRTALTGRIDSSVSLTSVIKTPYKEPGRNYSPGLYTENQVRRYINGEVPLEFMKDGKLDTANWRFVVWDVKVKGTATQPWQMKVEDLSAGSSGMQVIGYKDHSNPTTEYRFEVEAPYTSRYYSLKGEQTFTYEYKKEKSWGSRFYVVTAYPAAKVPSGATVQNQIKVVLNPIDQIDGPAEKTSSTASWSYSDYTWHFTDSPLAIGKYNNFGYNDTTVYTGWLNAFRQSSNTGKDYGELPYSVSSSFTGYEKTHWTANTSEGESFHTAGEYKPGAWYRLTTTDDVLYLHGNGADDATALTGADYYFSDVTITQTDYGYDLWEDEDRSSDLSRVASADLPDVLKDENGNPKSEVRVYAMLADPNPEEGYETDSKGWSLVHTASMDIAESDSPTSLTIRLGDVEGLLEQHPYRIKVEHDSMDYRSECRIDVKVRLRAVNDENETKYGPQRLEGVLEAHKDVGTNTKTPAFELENLGGNMCQIYKNSNATGFYGRTSSDSDYTSRKDDLSSLTEQLYDYGTDGGGRRLHRDNASREITWLNEVAQANKEAKITNDTDNSRVLVDYYLTAYDGYEIYDRDCLNYLKEEDQNLISPHRNHVVFYDLLPYGMQYDASAAPVAGRIANLDTQGYYKTRTNSWKTAQVSVTVDPEKDIIPDYRGTGRTMVAFHIVFDGADASSYTAQKWIEGWGVNFRAYFDWKDINQINKVDANANLCAFMPDFGESAGGSNNSRPALCGLESEVYYDNGTFGDNTAVAAAYEDMVKADAEGTVGNIDGVRTVTVTDGEGNTVTVDIDNNYRTVLYAKNDLKEDVALASESKIETLVHAEADRLGAYGSIATVPVSADVQGLYTYDNTLTVSAPSKNIVLFDRLEHVGPDNRETDPFAPFPEKKWTGTFCSVDTSGLTKQGIEHTVYYSDREEGAALPSKEQAPELTEANGWYTKEAFIREFDQKEGKSWQEQVKAVAVALNPEYELAANSSVSFRVRMAAPVPQDEKLYGTYTYNNASYYAETTTTNVKNIGESNAVRVCISRPETLEVIKKTSGDVPSELRNERFQFHIYEAYEYDGETEEKDLAYAEYKLYRQNRQGEWIEQTGEAHATDGSGYFYLQADEKAVFGIAGVDHLTVKETENVFWECRVENRTWKIVDGRRIGSADGDIHTMTVTNVYRPVLYVQKSLRAVPAGVTTDPEETFTFKIETWNGTEYQELPEAEYWKVDSVRLDGGIPTKVETNPKILRTGTDGTFSIRAGEILALFPGTAGTRYRLSEVIPKDTDDTVWNWYCEKSVLEESLPSGGDSQTLTNYYRWKDLMLTKEITHQSKAEYDTGGQKFTFCLYEPKLDAQGNPVLDENDRPVPKTVNGKYTTSGLKWNIVRKSEADDTAEMSGEIGEDGTFTGLFGCRTVRIQGLEAGKLYVLQELTDGIDKEDGKLLYVPDNDLIEVKMPVYSTGSTVTVTNDYRKRPLTVKKTVAKATDPDGGEPTPSEGTEEEQYEFQVKMERPLADGTRKLLPVAGISYTVTDKSGEQTNMTLNANGIFYLTDGQTAVFKDIGMPGDVYTVTENNNTLQIFPAERKPATGSLTGDGGEASFINGDSDSLLISKVYTGLDETARDLIEKWKADAEAGRLPNSTDPEKGYLSVPDWDACFILNVTVNGVPYEEEFPVTVVNQINGTSYRAWWVSGAEFQIAPWQTASIDVGERGIPEDAVYTLEEVEEDRMGMYMPNPVTRHWMQISQRESSKELKTAKPVAERSVAVLYNDINTLDPFAGSQSRKCMTPASGDVPAGAKLVWRAEQYDGGRWTPAEGVRYAVFSQNTGLPVSSRVESTEADGRILLVKQEGDMPYVMFQQEQVYLNLYDQADISRLEGIPGNGRLLRLVEVPEESDPEWGRLAGYAYVPSPKKKSSGYRPDKTEDDVVLPYAMSTAPDKAVGFVNSNVDDTLEIAKQMEEASETKFTMILRQVLSVRSEDGTVSDENQIVSAPAAGIPYTIYGTEKTGVTGPNGEIEIYRGERAVLNVPEGTMWTISEQEFSTPNYKLKDLLPENGTDSRLQKLNRNLMLVNLPASVRYSLIFDDNEGTGGPGELSQTFRTDPGKAVFTIPDIAPEREGYTFLGWSTGDLAEEPAYKPGQSVALEDRYTMRLYAVWAKEINVKLYNCYYINDERIARAGGGTTTVVAGKIQVSKDSKYTVDGKAYVFQLSGVLVNGRTVKCEVEDGWLVLPQELLASEFDKVELRYDHYTSVSVLIAGVDGDQIKELLRTSLNNDYLPGVEAMEYKLRDASVSDPKGTPVVNPNYTFKGVIVCDGKISPSDNNAKDKVKAVLDAGALIPSELRYFFYQEWGRNYEYIVLPPFEKETQTVVLVYEWDPEPVDPVDPTPVDPTPVNPQPVDPVAPSSAAQ